MQTQTNIKIEFSISSNKKLNFEDITQRLEVLPTSQCLLHLNKQDRPEYTWEYATDKIETLDVGDVISQITQRFAAKEQILRDIKEEYDAVLKCCIVVEIEQGQTPGLYLDKETLHFLSNIEAELDIDLYVMS